MDTKIKNNTLISVVMPVYNHSKYIASAINSILNQTYRNIELIIVDDGSTDGSSDIAKKMAIQDVRIKYVYKNNGGTGSALNVGFGLAGGEYGTWVSSDNFYYSNMLSTFYNVLFNNNNSGFVFSSFDIHKNDLYVCTHKIDGISTTAVLKNFIKLSSSACITGICYLYSMCLKNKCGPFLEIPGEDYYMGVCMGFETNVFYVPTSLGIYKSHCNSVSGRLEQNPSLHIKDGGISAVEMVKNLILAKTILNAGGV